MSLAQMCGREPGEHQLDQQLGRKSVREHERLGAAVGRGGEQFKGAATVGLGAAATAVRVGSQVPECRSTMGVMIVSAFKSLGARN
jgi:hypothetical protein